ncbi:MAG: hypothetical protein ACO3JG_08725 [Luteolibacter sp.]
MAQVEQTAAGRGGAEDGEQEPDSNATLSVQLRQLEESPGHPLFEREHKSLVLAGAGRIALDYADTIARAGEELAAVMGQRGGERRQELRVGALATISRNFQLQYLRPLLGRDDVGLVLRSCRLREGENHAGRPDECRRMGLRHDRPQLLELLGQGTADFRDFAGGDAAFEHLENRCHARLGIDRFRDA